jgi:hypothetical protein
MVISAHARHATSAEAGHVTFAKAGHVTSAKATNMTSAEATNMTSAEATNMTSAEATHGTCAEAAAPVSSASASAATPASLRTRRKQGPGQQGGRQYHHCSSSSHDIFLSMARAISEDFAPRPHMVARLPIANGKFRRHQSEQPMAPGQHTSIATKDAEVASCSGRGECFNVMVRHGCSVGTSLTLADKISEFLLTSETETQPPYLLGNYPRAPRRQTIIPYAVVMCEGTLSCGVALRLLTQNLMGIDGSRAHTRIVPICGTPPSDFGLSFPPSWGRIFGVQQVNQGPLHASALAGFRLFSRSLAYRANGL